MDLWYSEYHADDVRFSIKIKQHLHSEKSRYQEIDIFDSLEFGRFLTLDGVMMLTEKDEFIYHEMIVHVPMAVFPNASSVLVIGAGDGGAVRELLKYPGIRQIDVVEIDRRVVEVCKQYLPQTAAFFEDERVSLHYEDGLKFVRSKRDCYDIIIVDSTDPFGPGEGLFTKEFYGNCFHALTDQGILVNQHESPFYSKDKVAMQRAHKRLHDSFPLAYVYQAHIPTYPSGHWLFGFSSKGAHPVRDLQAEAWGQLGLKTKYYNPKLHAGAFCLPNYVLEALADAE